MSTNEEHFHWPPSDPKVVKNVVYLATVDPYKDKKLGEKAKINEH